MGPPFGVVAHCSEKEFLLKWAFMMTQVKNVAQGDYSELVKQMRHCQSSLQSNCLSLHRPLQPRLGSSASWEPILAVAACFHVQCIASQMQQMFEHALAKTKALIVDKVQPRSTTMEWDNRRVEKPNATAQKKFLGTEGAELRFRGVFGVGITPGRLGSKGIKSRAGEFQQLVELVKI